MWLEEAAVWQRGQVGDEGQRVRVCVHSLALHRLASCRKTFELSALVSEEVSAVPLARKTSEPEAQQCAAA